MTREESAKWAALLQAQADGKPLEYMDWNHGEWVPASLRPTDFGGSPEKWRIAPDLPPKPSQEWLDKHGVELTGECRRPTENELTCCAHEGWEVPQRCEFPETWKTPYWILRRRAPVVKPLSLSHDHLGMCIVRKDNTGSGIISGIRDGQFIIPGWGKAPPAELARDWTRLDGSPCGEVAK